MINIGCYNLDSGLEAIIVYNENSFVQIVKIAREAPRFQCELIWYINGLVDRRITNEKGIPSINITFSSEFPERIKTQLESLINIYNDIFGPVQIEE